MLLAAGYFDESTDGEFGDRVFSVGGYIASGPLALDVEFQWQKLLDRYELRYFKASEQESLIGEFAKFRDDPGKATKARFTEREKDFQRSVKIEFVDVLYRQKDLIGISATVNMRDLKAFGRDYPHLAKCLTKPVYNLCAHLVMLEAGILMNETNRANPTHYQALLRPIFDSHKDYELNMRSSFPKFKEKNPASSISLLPPLFEDERKHVCLQAADLFVYEIRRSVSNMFFEPRIEMRKAMKKLFPQSMSNYVLDYEALKLIADANIGDSIPIEKL